MVIGSRIGRFCQVNSPFKLFKRSLLKAVEYFIELCRIYPLHSYGLLTYQAIGHF